MCFTFLYLHPQESHSTSILKYSIGVEFEQWQLAIWKCCMESIIHYFFPFILKLILLYLLFHIAGGRINFTLHCILFCLRGQTPVPHFALNFSVVLGRNGFITIIFSPLEHQVSSSWIRDTMQTHLVEIRAAPRCACLCPFLTLLHLNSSTLHPLWAVAILAAHERAGAFLSLTAWAGRVLRGDGVRPDWAVVWTDALTDALKPRLDAGSRPEP